ncbi:pentatricopeptide repeat-containing protein At4g14050, mitochondrial-like [Cryptomeria japonica]|uniref:pentatricopeptide repeat-containing protein At4g14050, mitochondrial-like n=1 Tax=Cryptomeria japonica TaxID=3369 RepID=UPI0027DA1094|nr:pentatricopeptide repeat-containing protein At4g14050, mitochondrial-like [Cryptomeria japonica]
MLVTRYQIRNINTVSTLKQLLQFNQHTFNDYGCDNLRFKAIQCMEVDFTSFASLLKQCTKTKAVAQGKIAHAYIIKTGFQQEVFVGNNLINLYAKCGMLKDARKVFDKMSKRGVISWTALMTAYAQSGHGCEALEIFMQMQVDGLKPDNYTLATAVNACSSLAALERGKQVHGHFIAGGFELDDVAKSALMDMYAKCGCLEDARQMFDNITERNPVSWNGMVLGYAQNGRLDDAWKLFCQMPKPDTLTWTVIIVGYVQIGDGVRAVELFHQMLNEGVKSDHFTLSSILGACAGLAVLEQGRQFHAYATGTGFESSVFVGNALVDMYSKCGAMEDALHLFNRMLIRDIVSWTTMIVGCAEHGQGKEALQLYKQMLSAGLTPNNITFVGLLYACSHAGLVEEGFRYFNSMTQDYDISPTLEHYTCVLDLLGRAGFLNEAEEFVSNMPVKPDATIWRALLGACRIHGNTDKAQRTAERLIELKLEDSSTYVLLSNTYAAAGRWEDVAKVRKLMIGRELKKQPGCSWIEVRHKTHVFFVGEISHPQKVEIHAMLEWLFAQMKAVGYYPNTNLVLHNVEDY